MQPNSMDTDTPGVEAETPENSTPAEVPPAEEITTDNDTPITGVV